MSHSLPWLLFLAWVFFSGFVDTHRRHAANFHGSSQGFLVALSASAILGWVVGFGLLIYYFVRVAWYWPLVLLVLGGTVGAFLFGILDRLIGQLILSLFAFLGWPAAALWAFLIVRRFSP
jgi:hypothetical protein